MQLYPLLFEPNLHPVVWGGDQLRRYKGLTSDGVTESRKYGSTDQRNDGVTEEGRGMAVEEPIGESWEVSAVPSSTSRVANGEFQGKNLISVINEFPEEILGKAVAEKYHGKLPLLVKFIDAQKDLSI